MSLIRPSTGNTIAASHVDQLVDVLQRSSGQTETGKYVISMAIYTSNGSCSWYYPSLSRGATPVSVSVDHADIGFSQCSSVNATNLTANGFEIYLGSTTSGSNGGCGGNVTISY
jgi:hypothetical protein